MIFIALIALLVVWELVARYRKSRVERGETEALRKASEGVAALSKQEKEARFIAKARAFGGGGYQLHRIKTLSPELVPYRVLDTQFLEDVLLSGEDEVRGAALALLASVRGLESQQTIVSLVSTLQDELVTSKQTYEALRPAFELEEMALKKKHHILDERFKHTYLSRASMKIDLIQVSGNLLREMGSPDAEGIERLGEQLEFRRRFVEGRSLRLDYMHLTPDQIRTKLGKANPDLCLHWWESHGVGSDEEYWVFWKCHRCEIKVSTCPAGYET